MAGTVDETWASRWIKRALLLIVIGLVVQLFCLWAITPATFLVFAGIGVGLVLVGIAMFIWAGTRHRRRATATAKEADGEA